MKFGRAILIDPCVIFFYQFFIIIITIFFHIHQDNVILVVLCVYGRVWSGVAGWLVAWDTTVKQSYWLLSYKHSPLLQNGLVNYVKLLIIII